MLLIILAFFIGLTIKFYRHSMAAHETDPLWEEERAQIYDDFRNAAQEETFVAEKRQPQKAAISKEAITGRININSASFEELQILPRVGPATAQKIIDYRSMHGEFKIIEDVQNVKSIGPKTFEKIKEYITVD